MVPVHGRRRPPRARRAHGLGPGHLTRIDPIPDMSSAHTLSMATRVVASDQQVACDVADEVVLLSMQNGQYYGLNAVGASIWRLIQQPRALDEVRDGLLAEYEDVYADTCVQETMTFVTNMLALGLIQLL